MSVSGITYTLNHKMSKKLVTVFTLIGLMGGFQPAAFSATGDEADVPRAPTAEEESQMTPISFKKSTGASSQQRNIRMHSALIKHNGDAALEFEHPTILQLKDGEIIVDADKLTVVKTPHSILTIKPGCIALVSVTNKVTKVRNLLETGTADLRQSVGGKFVDIAAGEESILGWDQMGVNKALSKDNLGRRRVRGIDVPGGMFMQRAEIPLTTLMQLENSPALHDLVTSENPADKALADKLVKMAAVQQQVQAKHGQFLQYAQAPHK